jgi:hypothetical protein
MLCPSGYVFATTLYLLVLMAFFTQISFSTIIYPSLVLAYLGQGARLVTEGEAVLSNLFYTTIPGGSNGPLFWLVQSRRPAWLRRADLAQDRLRFRRAGLRAYFIDRFLRTVSTSGS